ncbi:hypothetical protein [Microseira sp. BLCC-F43]|uniref:hypothetical protein n=1 Tax=Microseira sp. BLCC-F43 TaxID=3153602 RepID=UPI0035B95E66
MTSVVTDTHALIWYIFDLDRLSEAALTAFEQAVNAGNPIAACSRVRYSDIAEFVKRAPLRVRA